MCLVKMRSETGKVYSVECVVIGSCVGLSRKKEKEFRFHSFADCVEEELAPITNTEKQ